MLWGALRPEQAVFWVQDGLGRRVPTEAFIGRALILCTRGCLAIAVCLQRCAGLRIAPSDTAADA